MNQTKLVYLNILRLLIIIYIRSVYLTAQSLNEDLHKLINLESIIYKFLQPDAFYDYDYFLCIPVYNQYSFPLCELIVKVTKSCLDRHSRDSNTQSRVCGRKLYHWTTVPPQDHYRLHSLNHYFHTRMASAKAKIDAICIIIIIKTRH